MTRGVCVALLALVVLGCGGPSQPTPVTTTFLSFSSQPGDYIGQGATQRYTLADGSWNATYAAQYAGAALLTVSIHPATGPYSWWWNLNLAPPQGQSLSVGTFENARRWPFQPPTQPGLDFGGTGRGCNTLTGRFVILELALGPGNTVDRLHATFEQHCEGASPALTGEVSIVANPWR